MINSGGDVNHQNRRGRTALHELCSQANWTLCVYFLSLFPSVDVNCMDMNRETPLHVAVRANHPRLVEILLDFGAHPDISGIFLPHGKETELTGENP
jgi:ankyrin repeat protein